MNGLPMVEGLVALGLALASVRAKETAVSGGRAGWTPCAVTGPRGSGQLPVTAPAVEARPAGDRGPVAP